MFGFSTARRKFKLSLSSPHAIGNESPVNGASHVTAASPFTDVPSDYFAAAAIATLHARAIVDGAGGLIRPNDPVTRAEFAKMLLGARRQQPSGPSNRFSDVVTTDPLAVFVGAVVDRGWAAGQSDRFFPSRAVSRYEAATMIVRAAGLSLATTNAYADVVDGVERQMIGAFVQAGIASGENGLFAPHRALTRGEDALEDRRLTIGIAHPPSCGRRDAVGRYVLTARCAALIAARMP